MKNNNTVKALVSGYYGFANFGDETILSILTQKLKDIGCKVTVFSSAPKVTAELYDVNTVNSFDYKNIIPTIIKNDVLVSGGGSLLQDVTSLKSLIYYLIIINIALFLRKKVIIFAQGIGPINNKFGAFLTKNTLRRCNYACVRDRKSRLLLKKWGIEADLVCDPIFELPVIQHKPENIMGIQLRKFKTLNINYLEKLADYINKDFSDKKIEIFSFQDSLDLEICQKFEELLKKINPEIKTEIISNASSQEILDRFSKLEFLIAMRFHANLIALKYGIKTLALSYDVKVEKLAEEAEIPCLQMKSDDNIEQAFVQMHSLNKEKMIEFANSKSFDWDKIEKILT